MTDRMWADDEQLRAVLRSTIEFLHAQGCGEASSAVSAALMMLDRPSPLKWELRGDDNEEWRITLVDPTNCYASIERVP